MDELAERIRASFENPNSDPWFPEFTGKLTTRAWDGLRRDIGISPSSYGTERVFCRNVSAPRNIITYLKTGPLAGDEGPTIAIEALSEGSAYHYRKAGVGFCSPEEVLNTTVPTCIQEALDIVNQVPSLMTTVASLVRSLHVIRPERADYDVSFSEPHFPFSIFISTPQERIANDALRVAEAIVHEAMHLQLTLIDKISPLTISTSKTYFSPWKKTHRKAEGVLQALYVFRVIEQFFSKLLLLPTAPPHVANHVRERRREIDFQIATLRSFQHCDELTSIGSKFVRSLIGQDNSGQFVEMTPNQR